MQPLTHQERTTTTFFSHELIQILTTLQVNQRWEIRKDEINRVELGYTITEAHNNFNNLDYYNGRTNATRHWRLNLIANVYPNASFVPNEEPIRTGTFRLNSSGSEQMLKFCWSRPILPLLDEFILHMHHEIVSIHQSMIDCGREPDYGLQSWDFENATHIGGDLVISFAQRIADLHNMPLSKFYEHYDYWVERFYHGCRFWTLLVRDANFNITQQAAVKFLDMRPPYGWQHLY